MVALVQQEHFEADLRLEIVELESFVEIGRGAGRIGLCVNAAPVDRAEAESAELERLAGLKIDDAKFRMGRKTRATA